MMHQVVERFLRQMSEDEATASTKNKWLWQLLTVETVAEPAGSSGIGGIASGGNKRRSSLMTKKRKSTLKGVRP